MSGVDRLRLDKWLWRARFFKTRAIAADAVETGKVRVNGRRLAKPGAGVKCGDVLTIRRAGAVLLVRIEAFGERRGPAAEAQTLYHALDPTEAAPAASAHLDDASGSD